MNVSPLTGAIPGATGTPAEAGLDGEAFLSLLMAQLGNQDPTSPVETNEFMQQLTSLNTVQQLVEANNRLDELAQGVTSLNHEGAVQLVGKEVTAVSNTFVLEEGVTETLEYDLPKDADVHIIVRDASGRPVDTMTLGPQDAGPRTARWRPDNAPPGQYTFEVVAEGDDGEKMPVTTYTTGVVDELRFDAGFPVLVVDGHPIALGDVITVRAGPEGLPAANVPDPDPKPPAEPAVPQTPTASFTALAANPE